MSKKDNSGKRRSKTSCLIQLLIVVVVMLILAAIAIPDFLKFCGKAKASEAKTNLGAIFTSQVAYFGENGRYAGHQGGKKCFELLGWAPEGQTSYSYYCDTDAIPNTREFIKCPAPDAQPVKQDSFIIYAVGNIDADSVCDVWTIDEKKQLRNRVNDLAE